MNRNTEKNEERNLGSVFNLAYPSYKIKKRMRNKDTNELNYILSI